MKRNIIMYYFVQFFTGLIFTISIWVPFYRQYISFTEMSLLTVIQTFTNLILQLPTGALADLIGRKKCQILGWFLQGLGSILTPINTTFSGFIFATIIIGIGASLVSGADGALIYDSLKELNKTEDYPKISARNGFLYRIGMVIAILIGGYLYQFSQSLPYQLKGLAYLSAIIFILFMIEPKIGKENFNLSSFKRKMISGFREIFKNNYLKKFSLYYVLVAAISWSILFNFSQTFSYEFKFTETENSIMFSLIYLIYSLIIIVIVHFKNKISKKIFLLSFPITLSIFLLPSLILPKILVPIFLLFVMLPGGARFSILDKFMHEEFESKNRATAMSALSMLSNIGLMILVFGGGLILDLSPIYGARIVFTILGVLSAILIIPLSINIAKIKR